MITNNDENQIPFKFDLEKEYDKNNIHNIDLQTLFEELVRVLNIIDKRM
jgi:hypothetical protein